ncbi:MAG: Hsp33 family molecular chaperone HslO [Burkholderiales bacterium]|jgi:molecular chaperone Hsp33|nr:Hsp33 family molecular chaperone HslO [Burkholderiales bacterium]
MSDRLLKFLFHDAPVRGEVVQLARAWQQVIEHHDYPAPVLALLGEMTAAATLLAANIKFNGALTLQVHGDGPVKLLVVECQPDFRLRATAKLRADAHIAPGAGLRALVNAHGQGRCAITLDPLERLPGQQPYQGIVPLTGDSIAHALETYMRQSEQLDTRLWLAADDKVASGVLLQKLPAEGGRATQSHDTDAWDRTTTLASTLTLAELLANGPEALVRKLFWQERLEHGAAFQPSFRCSCSRERIGRMLLSLGRGEVEDIVREQGHVEVTCDFCNKAQLFDAVDVAQLFATGETSARVPDRKH